MGIKGDNVFFAGLLEGLAQWWDGLGWAGQVLMTALGVMLIVALGGSFALAMGATGVMAWGLSHRRGAGRPGARPEECFHGLRHHCRPGPALS